MTMREADGLARRSGVAVSGAEGNEANEFKRTSSRDRNELESIGLPHGRRIRASGHTGGGDVTGATVISGRAKREPGS